MAYHPACSLQNSLKLNGVGEALLDAAGFIVTPFAESHLCCGSAGTYSILQPDLSSQLRARKLGNIAAAEPDVLVSGNIGCLQHLAAGRRPESAHPAYRGTAGLGRRRSQAGQSGISHAARTRARSYAQRSDSFPAADLRRRPGRAAPTTPCSVRAQAGRPARNSCSRQLKKAENAEDAHAIEQKLERDVPRLGQSQRGSADDARPRRRWRRRTTRPPKS